MTAQVRNAPGMDQPPPPRRRGLAGSAALMASGTLVSRLLGLVRNALLVAVVGITLGLADSWSVANKLPNIISMLLAGGVLNAVLVPQIVRAMKQKDGGHAYVNRLLTVGIVLLGALTVILTAAATVLVTIYAGSFTPEWRALTVALAYWCIPQLFFYGLYTLLGQVLNARSVFGPYMWAPVLNNVVAIGGLVAFLIIFGGQQNTTPEVWTSDRIALLAGTATLGVAAQALVLLIPLYRDGFRFRPTWGLRNSGLDRVSRVASWAFAALAVGQVGYLAVSNVAAAASAEADRQGATFAGNFAYDNAFLIFMLPQSLVTVSLVTALFTRLAGHAAARDGSAVRGDLSKGLRTLGVFTVLASASLAVLAIPLVQLVVLGSGDFAQWRAVGGVLVAMAFGLVSMGVWTMVQRVFYAYEDTRTLFRIQVPMAVILVIGCVLSWLVLDPRWWVVGAGVATTISNTVGATVGYLATRMYLPSLDGSRVLRTHLRLLMAVIPPALAGWWLLHLWGVQSSFLGALARVLVVGAVIVTGYLLLLKALRVVELDQLLARLEGPLRPLRRVAARVLPASMAAGGSVATRSMGAAGVGPRERGAPTMMSGTPTTLRAGEQIASRYELDRELDLGVPAGSVWSATDTALDRTVRVFLIDGVNREHVVDAARRAALISDKRLSRVLRAGAEDDLRFVVTDEVGGTTLAELIRTHGPLAPSQARALVGEAASAIEVARRRGVHHLTLRPGALLVTGNQVRVSGLAVDAAWHGVDVRHNSDAARTDAVALVELLYTALTGTWPGNPDLADGVPPAESAGEGPVPAGDVAAGVPNDLDTLCAVTLGGHDDGPLTAGQLVADLTPWGSIDLEHLPPPTVAPGLSPDTTGSMPLIPSSGVLGDELGQPALAEPALDPATSSGSGDRHDPGDPDEDSAAAAVDPDAPAAGGSGDEARAPATTPREVIDTSGWGLPLITAISSAPAFEEIVDTGSIPLLDRAPRHGRGPVSSVRLPAVLLPAATPPAGQLVEVGPMTGAAPAPGRRPALPQGDEQARPPFAPSATTPEHPGEGTDVEGGSAHGAAAPADVPPAPQVPEEADPALVEPPGGDVEESTQAAEPGGAAHVGSPPESEPAAVLPEVAHPTGAEIDPVDPDMGGDPPPPGAADPDPPAPEAVGAGVSEQRAAEHRVPVVRAVLSREQSGWDMPGTAAPARPSAPLPAQRIDAGAAGEPASPMSTGSVSAAAGAVGAAARTGAVTVARATSKVATGIIPAIKGTNRRIEDVTERVGSGAQGVLEGATGRLGRVTERATTFVDDVRQEFRPVPDDSETEGKRRNRFNPAPFVLCAMVAFVIFVLVLALTTLSEATGAYTHEPSATATAPAGDAEQEDPAEEEPVEPEPEPEPAPVAPTPLTIVEGITIDPSTGGGENQDQAFRAFDGNPETTWNSLRYNDPAYGMKPGLAYVVVLEQPSTVANVTLDVRGEGGLVEVRMGSRENPAGGTLLASGPMGPATVYTFSEPVETGEIILWFPELPRADSDGRNRIELAEIGVNAG